MISDGWKKQGQLARPEAWLCGPGEFSGILRRAFIAACGTVAGTERNSSMPWL